MEYILLFPLIFLARYFISKNLSTSTEEDFKSPITRLDDKNWIIDGKFVSFEEDTPVLRIRQKLEDNKHYHAYESEKLMRDRESLWKDYLKTTQAIKKFPNLEECVTPEKLEAITDEYEHYLKKCNKLEEDAILTKEEFLIRDENPTLCVDFSSFGIWIRKPIGAYIIHNEKTARYARGRMEDIMAKEFKEKWY